jgi:hypothetical protein
MPKIYLESHNPIHPITKKMQQKGFNAIEVWRAYSHSATLLWHVEYRNVIGHPFKLVLAQTIKDSISIIDAKL